MDNQTRKISKEEKVVRLLDYLRQYTDRYNPASIPQIERYFRKQGYEKFFGNKDTRKNLIKSLVMAMNTDGNGNLLPKEQWRIVYDDFVRENTPGSESLKSHHIVNIYYNQEFGDREVDVIIKSIQKNEEISDECRDELIGKIRKSLTNDNYHKRPLTPAQRRANELSQLRSDAWGAYWIRRKMGE